MISRDIAKDVSEGRVHGRFRVEFNKLAFTVSTTGAAIGFGTIPIGDLPTGMLFISQAKASVKFSTTDTDPVAAWNGDFSIGTDPTSDNALAGTDVNIIPSTPVGPAVARVAPAVTARRPNAAAVADLYFDNTTGNGELNLNFLIDAADMADSQTAVFLADGFVDIMLSVIP